MTALIQHRYEFLFLFDCENGNPNGDPDSGNAWENQALFDFSGRLLPAARNFSLLAKG